MEPNDEQPPRLTDEAGDRWRFDELQQLGAGATSEVWKGRDRESGRIVALKVARTEGDREILAREAHRLAWSLSPRLPELLAVGRVPEGCGEIAAGRPYLAMSWIPGSPLDPRAPRSEDERRAIALAVARDIGRALAHLETAGLAHGDVKPDNIQLVYEQGAAPAWRAHLIDSGARRGCRRPAPHRGDSPLPTARTLGGRPRRRCPHAR